MSPLVNSLKHNHAQLQGFYFQGPDELRLGYFLEELGADRAVGPSTRVHKDGNSAFSFSRDLLINLYFLYQISEQLVSSASAYLRLKYKLTIMESKREEHTDIRRVVETAASIQQKFFPDELTKPCAVVELDPLKSRVRLSYPKTPNEQKFPKLQLACFMEPDAKSMTFKLPYSGTRSPWVQSHLTN